MQGDEQLAIIIPMLREVGAGITPAQLHGPTPCAAFDVADVLGHMAGLASTYAPAFRGDVLPDVDETAEVGDGDLVARFQEAIGALLEAVHSPGALDRTIATPLGPMPGAAFARMVAFDGLIHGWDLATSTAQRWDPIDDVVAAADAFARQMITPEMREGGAFGPQTQAQDGAARLLRLVAFTGRATA